MYDVLVAGAGPAGSTTAGCCAARGLSVMILEKAKFPREKPCGGGVNVRAARALPFDLSPVVERTIYGICFSLREAGAFTRFASEPLTYLTQRPRLDSYLLEQALSAGAELREGTPVQSVERGSDQVRVKAGGQTLIGRTLVVADGANGVTARLAGFSPAYQRFIGLEGNLTPRGRFPQEWERTLGIDLGILPGGYGWIFPKGDHLNLGVYGWRNTGPRLRAELERLARFYGRDPADLRDVRGHYLPARMPGAPLAEGNVLLVGDAAGLIDPMMGEGIYAAIWSGSAAARHLADYLNGTVPVLTGYQEQVERDFEAERRSSRRFYEALNLFPSAATWLMRSSSVAWDLLCALVRGDLGYRDMQRRLGPIGLGIDFFSDLLRISPLLQRRVEMLDPPAPEGLPFHRGQH